MSTHIARALSLALLAFVPAANANAPSDYAYTFPLATTAGGTSQSAWRFELTPAAYAWVQDASLDDIEVFNAAGQPVPLAPLAADPATTVREHDAALPVLALPAVPLPNSTGNVHLVIDRDAQRIDLRESAAVAASAPRDVLLDARAFDHPLDRIVLGWETPAVGVVARFEVSAGDDLQGWHHAGGGTVLALEQDGARLERRDIALGDTRAKYLRLHRLDDGAELGGLSVRAFSRERDSAAPSHVWLDANPAPAPDEGEARAPGVIRFHYLLPAPLPVDSARIELANDNALARLDLSARMPGDAQGRWTGIANVTAFRLRSGDETIRNGEIALANGARLREFRIESHTPLATAPRLAFGFRPQAFVFLAEGDAPYTLAVGSAHARHANYPLEAALASLRAKLGKDWQPPLAQLGAARPSAGAAAFKPLPAPTPWRSWLLWGVLVAGAALVGGFALSLLRGAGRGADRP